MGIIHVPDLFNYALPIDHYISHAATGQKYLREIGILRVILVFFVFLSNRVDAVEIGYFVFRL